MNKSTTFQVNRNNLLHFVQASPAPLHTASEPQPLPHVGFTHFPVPGAVPFNYGCNNVGSRTRWNSLVHHHVSGSINIIYTYLCHTQCTHRLKQMHPSISPLWNHNNHHKKALCIVKSHHKNYIYCSDHPNGIHSHQQIGYMARHMILLMNVEITRRR